MDFGKSQAIAEAKGYRRGDVDYLVPEVKVGEKESTQSDIFSFGKMLGTAVKGEIFFQRFQNYICFTTIWPLRLLHRFSHVTFSVRFVCNQHCCEVLF